MVKQPFEKLGAGSTYLILDQFTNAVIGAAMWIVLAKFVDPSVIGQAMIVYSLSLTILGFSGFGVRVSLAKYIAEYNVKNHHNASRRVLRLGLRMGLMVGALSGIAIAIMSGYISTNVYQNPDLNLLIIIMMLTFLPLQSMLAGMLGGFQGKHKNRFVWMVDLVYEVGRLTGALVLMFMGLGALGIVMGFSIGSMLAVLAGYLFFIPKVFPKVPAMEGEPKPRMKDLVKFSGFNYLAMGMRALSMQIGVLILGTYSLESAAFFGLSVLISTVVGGILIGVSRAMLATAAEEFTMQRKDQVKQLLNTGLRLSLLFGGFIYIVMLITPESVLHIISKDYTQASSALQILVVYSIVSSIAMVIISVLNGANRADEVAKSYVSASIVTVALSVALIPMLSLVGAALAMLIGGVVNLSMSLYALKKKEQISLSPSSIMRPMVPVAAALVIGVSIMQFTEHHLIAVGVALLTYVGAAAMYRTISSNELGALTRLALNVLKLRD
jgi:O-antigen/teichoic acid export membrane protein